MTKNPPAGWFRDPDEDTQLRYWDGDVWTDHTAPVRTGGQVSSGEVIRAVPPVSPDSPASANAGYTASSATSSETVSRSTLSNDPPADEARVDGGKVESNFVVSQHPGRRRRRILVALVGGGVVAGALVLFALLDNGAERGANQGESATGSSSTVAASSTTSSSLSTTSAAPSSPTTLAPTPVAVIPEVVGRSPDDVRAGLEAAGLVLVAVSQSTPDRAAWGIALSQEPPSGTGIEPGAEVTVAFGTRPVECNDLAADVPSAGFADVDALDDPSASAAVDWASAAGLVGGTSEATFDPSGDLTRGQMIVVVWRYFCKPEGSGPSGFADATGKFYEPALEWGVEVGAVGRSATFNGEDAATKGQFLTVVWRALGSPETSGELPSGVGVSDYFAEPVRWASANGLLAEAELNGHATLTRLDGVTLLFLIETVVNPLVAG